MQEIVLTILGVVLGFVLREMKIANIPFIFENIMAYCNHDFALKLKI
jgi:hypothetical protein